MKRKLLFIAIPAVLVLAAGAVAVVLLSKSKPASVPEQNLDMSALPIQVQYLKIDDVNPGSVKEIKISIPKELGSPQVCAWQDGGSLALGEKVEYAAGGTPKKVSSVQIIAARFDAQGNTAWEKTYSDLGDGYVSQALTLPGGGFVFTYTTLAQSSDAPQKECIVFCGQDGSVLKTYSYGQQGILGRLCVTDTGDVFAAGGCVFSNGAPASQAGADDTNADVSILKFSPDGALLFAKKFGGGNYDSANGAVWVKDTGLVLSVSTQSSDGDIKLPVGITAGNGPMGMLVCFDGDGQEKWQYFEQGRVSYNQLLASGGGVAVSGYKDSKPFLIQLDAQGTKLWNADFGESGNYSIPCFASMPDGTVEAVIGKYAQGSAISDEWIVTLGSDGKAVRKAEQVHENITDLVPMADGGVLTIGVQNIKTVPQPPEINSIWYDTETIATRLDGSLNVQWRKVYDKYKDVNVRDIVVPLEGGSVVIEK